MIRYRPLWETMSQKKVTTYTLRVKHGMSHATVQRLQADQPVSTHTLNKLCEILNCRLDEVESMFQMMWIRKWDLRCLCFAGHRFIYV